MSDDVFKKDANGQQRMRYCDMIEQLSLLNAQVQCNALAEVISQVDIDKIAEGIDMLNPGERETLTKAEQDVLIKARIDERKNAAAAEVDTLRCAAEIIGRFASARHDDEDVNKKLSDELKDKTRGIWN